MELLGSCKAGDLYISAARDEILMVPASGRSITFDANHPAVQLIMSGGKEGQRNE